MCTHTICVRTCHQVFIISGKHTYKKYATIIITVVKYLLHTPYNRYYIYIINYLFILDIF
ncbi:hypothetical protein GpSGHVEth138 [Glossina pallidipes salivary gland hypertrophy virus]|uniref:Uncharacterized protein n=1 Tax=Glossina hytrovirus (isolate Glossina pallidipes/Ethiopia/Seibersdorf/-) TaxID=379529 RepID=A0A0Y0K7I5_GHVS|nr:hypothetical protein GpSGHVEth138 [Glossina pallidipes salivary gland hypertrophy virus]